MSCHVIRHGVNTCLSYMTAQSIALTPRENKIMCFSEVVSLGGCRQISSSLCWKYHPKALRTTTFQVVLLLGQRKLGTHVAVVHWVMTKGTRTVFRRSRAASQQLTGWSNTLVSTTYMSGLFTGIAIYLSIYIYICFTYSIYIYIYICGIVQWMFVRPPCCSIWCCVVV